MKNNEKDKKSSSSIKDDNLTYSLVITIVLVSIMFLLSLFFGD